MTTTTIDSWEATLTALEDELNDHEEQVRRGEPTLVPAWQPPAGLGPLPPHLAGRVANLVRRIGLLSTFVQYQLMAVEGDLAHLHRQQEHHGAKQGGVALFLDASV